MTLTKYKGTRAVTYGFRFWFRHRLYQRGRTREGGVMRLLVVALMLLLSGCVTITAKPCPSDPTLASEACLYLPNAPRPAAEATPTLPAGYNEAMHACAKLYRAVSIREAANGQITFHVDRLLTSDMVNTQRLFQGCVDGKVGKPLNWRNY